MANCARTNVTQSVGASTTFSAGSQVDYKNIPWASIIPHHSRD